MKLFLPVTLLALMASSLLWAAEDPVRENRQYLKLPDKPVADEFRAPIVQFVYYGCDACLKVEQELGAWLDEERVLRLPSVLRPAWRPAAKLWLALERIDADPAIHRQIMEALSAAPDASMKLEPLLALAVELGADEEALQAAITEPELYKALARIDALSDAWDVRGVPAFIVNGRFYTDANLTGTLDHLRRVLQALIDMPGQKDISISAAQIAAPAD